MTDTPCQSKEDPTGENWSNQKNFTGTYQLNRRTGGVRGQKAFRSHLKMLNDPRSRPKICLANGTHRAEDVTACFPPSLMVRPKSQEREVYSIALVAPECWKNGNWSKKRRLRPLTTFHELPLARGHMKLPRLWEITPQLLEVGEAFHLHQLRPLLLAQQFNVAEQVCLPSPSRVRLQESHQRGRAINMWRLHLRRPR